MIFKLNDLRFAAAALTMAAFCSVPVEASITLGDLVANLQNELEDDDFEMLVNSGGSVSSPGADTTLDVGDYLAGIFRIGSLRVPTGGPQAALAGDTEATITALFLTQVATKTISGPNLPDGTLDVVLTFTAAPLADWATVFDVPANIATASGTIAVLFEDPDNIDQTAGLGSFATADGPMAWELGHLGLPGEFWRAQSDTDDVTNAFATGTTGPFSANLNVTKYGIGPQLAPQAVSGGFADVLLRNGSFGSPATGADPPFPVSSDVDLLMRPVPEPASIVAWLGLLSFAALVRIRQLRK